MLGFSHEGRVYFCEQRSYIGICEIFLLYSVLELDPCQIFWDWLHPIEVIDHYICIPGVFDVGRAYLARKLRICEHFENLLSFFGASQQLRGNESQLHIEDHFSKEMAHSNHFHFNWEIVADLVKDLFMGELVAGILRKRRSSLTRPILFHFAGRWASVPANCVVVIALLPKPDSISTDLWAFIWRNFEAFSTWFAYMRRGAGETVSVARGAVIISCIESIIAWKPFVLFIVFRMEREFPAGLFVSVMARLTSKSKFSFIISLIFSRLMAFSIPKLKIVLETNKSQMFWVPDFILRDLDTLRAYLLESPHAHKSPLTIRIFHVLWGLFALSVYIIVPIIADEGSSDWRIMWVRPRLLAKLWHPVSTVNTNKVFELLVVDLIFGWPPAKASNFIMVFPANELSPIRIIIHDFWLLLAAFAFDIKEILNAD